MNGATSRVTRRPEGRDVAGLRASKGVQASKGLHAYAALKEAILSGRLAPGEPVDKAALCAQLGVSRFPVAAALNRLAFERLVVIAPQHGSFVARIALSDVLECMMLRSAIEGEAAALAAERQPAGLVEALDHGLAAQHRAVTSGDTPAFYALDADFHAAIPASLDMPHAASILDGLRARLERIRRILTAPPGRAAQAATAHATIRDAIAAGRAGEARLALRDHLDETTALFKTFAFDHPSLFSDLC